MEASTWSDTDMPVPLEIHEGQLLRFREHNVLLHLVQLRGRQSFEHDATVHKSQASQASSPAAMHVFALVAVQ